MLPRIVRELAAVVRCQPKQYEVYCYNKRGPGLHLDLENVYRPGNGDKILGALIPPKKRTPRNVFAIFATLDLPNVVPFGFSSRRLPRAESRAS